MTEQSSIFALRDAWIDAEDACWAAHQEFLRLKAAAEKAKATYTTAFIKAGDQNNIRRSV
jgi:hypothetical protein